MLRRRIERLERGDDTAGELVGVVVMDGEDADDRIAEECARRGVSPDRASLAVVRVPMIAASMEAWQEEWTAGRAPAESEV